MYDSSTCNLSLCDIEKPQDKYLVEKGCQHIDVIHKTPEQAFGISYVDRTYCIYKTDMYVCYLHCRLDRSCPIFWKLDLCYVCWRGPGFNSRLCQVLNICVTFFSAKVDSTFHPYGVDKMSTSFCWGLKCDGLVSRPGVVSDSHPPNTTETGEKCWLQWATLARKRIFSLCKYS